MTSPWTEVADRVVVRRYPFFDQDIVVVLGGGVMQARDVFLEPIRAAVRRWAQPIALGQCRIEATALGADAGVLGAARLALPGPLFTP